MSLKLKLLIVLLLPIIGYAVGRYLQPPKVEVKREEVIKEVEVTKKNVLTKERTTTQKDGTSVTERTIEENSTSTNNTTTHKEESVVVSNKPNYRVKGGAGMSVGDSSLVYSVGVDTRIAGPVFVGLDVDTTTSYKLDKVRLGLSMEF